MKPTTIAACAPSTGLLDALAGVLQEAGSYDVVRVETTGELSSARDRVDAAILFCPKGFSDFVLLAHLQELGEKKPFVIVGGEPHSVSGVTCWLASLPPPELLKALLEQIVALGPGSSWPRRTAFAYEEAPSSTHGGVKGFRRKTDVILGESRATRKLLYDLDRVARSAALVLVTGESGTGKELVARALHYCGPRAGEPFIAVNCAAIPEQLFEAELFGYQRGAFTGAVSSRAGVFEAAGKGTLFLDEIGEMPRAMQPKLLRVLETSEVTRLGSTDAREVTARIVVATNRDLDEEVRTGRFREDLFYRLNVYPVHVEPLRHRPDDIPAIVAHHLGILASREGRATPRLTPAALERLFKYAWPGNVRELVHVLGRAVLVAPKDVIDAGDIRLPTSRDSAKEEAAVSRYRDAKQSFDKDYYSRLMRLANGNVALAARLADKTRKEVYDALKRVGLDASPYRHGATEES